MTRRHQKQDDASFKKHSLVRLPDEPVLHPEPLRGLGGERDDPVRADHGQDREAGQGLLLRHARTGKVRCFFFNQMYLNLINVSLATEIPKELLKRTGLVLCW